MGIREEKAEFTEKIVQRIMHALEPEFGDIFRTGANMSTVTFELGDFHDTPLYGSVKFTLHKPSYNLDDEIEDFEDFYAMRAKKAQEKERASEEKENE